MSKNPRKMWEKALPLRVAYIDYFGFPNHENDEDAKQKRFNYSVLELPVEPGEFDPYDPECFRFSPESPQHRRELRNEIRNSLCISLNNLLRADKLIAVGIKFEGNGNKHYVEIPITQIEKLHIDKSDELTFADIQNGGIRKICESWDEDIFYGITDKYESVRIYDPRFNIDGTPNKKHFPEKYAEREKQYSDKPGKPTKEKVVLEVFNKLESENKIDFLGKQIEAARIIQRYIEKEMPDLWDGGKYLDEKTIANHIREDFNAEKDRAKATKKNS